MRDAKRSFLELLSTTNGEDLEADALELVGVEDSTTVEDKSASVGHSGQLGKVEDTSEGGEDLRWLGHAIVDCLPVERLELIPLGSDDDALSAESSLHSRVADGHLLLDCAR